MITLSPSSAARRMACPGSRALEAQYPSERNDSADEGVLAHEVAATKLKRLFSPFPPYNVLDSISYTNEMIEGAELYVNEIFSETKGKIVLHIEEKLDGPITVDETEVAKIVGTPDCWAHDEENKIIYVWDYKYGHRYVEVFENWQLLEYAALITGPLFSSLDFSEYKVVFTIVQPRSFCQEGPIRKWIVDFYTYMSYILKMGSFEHDAIQPDARCTPSPECNYCSARAMCKALQQAALTATDISTDNTPFELPPAALGSELRYLQRAKKLIEARCTGLEEQALGSIKRGERIPYFTTMQSAGLERWAKPVDEVLQMGVMYECDLKKPADAITPKQAIKAGVPAEVVRGYSETPLGAIKLVADDGKEARKLFGGSK